MSGDEGELTASEACDLLQDALLENGAAHTSIDAFDAFVEHKLQDMFSAFARRLVVERDPTATQRQNRSANMAPPSPTDVVSCEVIVGNLMLNRPCVIESDGRRCAILPAEARARHLTYAVEMYTTARRTVRMRGGESKTDDITQRIGWLPVVVGSKLCHMHGLTDDEKIHLGECPLDPGGYFIINGSERTIVAHERRAYNEALVFPTKSNSRFGTMVEVHSQTPESGKAATSVQILLRAREGEPAEVVAALTYCKTDLNLFVLLRAMGLETDEEMLNHILCHTHGDEAHARMFATLLEPAMAEARVRAPTVQAARAVVGTSAQPSFLGSPWMSAAGREGWTVERFLSHEVLPHIGIGMDSCADKACFIGLMVYRLLAVHFKLRPFADRDHYRNKRTDTTGPLIGQVLRQLFKQFFKSTRSYMQKRVNLGLEPDLLSTLREDAISRGVAQCIVTGNWQVGKMSSMIQKTGVAQPLNRLNLTATLSAPRRTNAPVLREGKLAQPRMLHNSHFGKLCPVETPEGKQCGLVRNHASLLHFSLGLDAPVPVRTAVCLAIRDRLVPAPAAVRSREVMRSGAKIFIDGAWVGVHTDPERAAEALREMRGSGLLPMELGIALDRKHGELRVHLDQGRAMRPLFVVDPETNRLRLTRKVLRSLGPRPRWKRLLALGGYVELVDPDEEDTLRAVAMGVKDLAVRGRTMAFSHCEIDPSAQLGVVAACLPNSEFNQSPRNSYQSAMAKQSFGTPTTNAHRRMDTNRHVLCHPQRPLVTTRASRTLGHDVLPAGQNVVLAVLSGADNIEDAMIFNRASVERGVLRSLFFHTHSDSEGIHGTAQEERFERPRRGTLRGPNYGADGAIDEDGLPAPRTFVGPDDIIIGKTLTVSRDDAEARNHPSGPTKIDKSHVARAMDAAMVERVMVSTGTDPAGKRNVKVQTRKLRIPCVGDKFASRHGQKGVMGAMWESCEMPYTASGIVPDILMNPHAVPSRMTIGQMVESIMGKIGAVEGRFMDGTPFSSWVPESSKAGAPRVVDELMEQLERHGFHGDGAEQMFDGQTGAPLEARVCIGIVHMQRLKHMVSDKHNARDRGPRQILTQQPVEGRGRSGGQRFGEMERDALIAHGTSDIMRDRLFMSSDYSSVWVCSSCGLMGGGVGGDGTRCSCDAKSRLIELPRSTMVLFYEAQSMLVALRFGSSPDRDPAPAPGKLPTRTMPAALHACVD